MKLKEVELDSLQWEKESLSRLKLITTLLNISKSIDILLQLLKGNRRGTIY